MIGRGGNLIYVFSLQKPPDAICTYLYCTISIRNTIYLYCTPPPELFVTICATYAFMDLITYVSQKNKNPNKSQGQNKLFNQRSIFFRRTPRHNFQQLFSFHLVIDNIGRITHQLQSQITFIKFFSNGPSKTG